MTSSSQRWNGCQNGVSHDTRSHCQILTDWVIHIISDKTGLLAYTDVLIICTFVALACPIQSIWQPHRDQLERHNYGTNSNHFSYSCCLYIDKTNETPNHWRSNGLRKVNSETYVLQTVLYGVYIRSVQPAPMTLFVFHPNTICQEKRKKAFVWPWLWEWGALSSLHKFWPIYFCLKKLKFWPRYGRYICYLHSTSVWPWPVFKAYFGN